jgi:hypothetical protein
MPQKHARKVRIAPRPQPATPTAPACRLAHTAEGDRVQRIPTEDEIRLRAYLQWEAAGQPPGDGREFWFYAERALGGTP